MRKVILLILLLLLVTLYAISPNTMDSIRMSVVLIIVVFSTFLFFTKKEKILELNGQFLKHSNLFVFGFLVVHFQLYTDFVLGNITKDDTFIWVNQSIVLKSMILSAIGLLSFFLGFSFNKFNYSHVIREFRVGKEKYISVKFLTYLSTIVLTVYFYTVNPLYLLGFYGSENMGVTATYMSLLFNLLIFAVIIQTSRNLRNQNKIPTNFKQYIKLMNYHLLILLVLYLISVILSGDRGPLMTYGLCFISGYFFVKKIKLSYKKGILFIFTGAIMMFILGMARNLNKDLSFTDKIQLSLTENANDSRISFLPVTNELAGSVRTLHHAVNYVPLNHDFLYGRFQLQYLTVAFPFFSIFSPIIYEDTSWKYAGSSSFITWIRQGNFPTSGDGTSCIADFYLDFGMFGVLVGMFGFGYFMRFAEVKMFSANIPNLFLHVLIIVYLSDAIYISRSSVLFGFKSIVLIYSILIINKYIFNKTRL
jgi:oligosaccharide repeat unit polymerase